jgi:hypothetical protein
MEFLLVVGGYFFLLWAACSLPADEKRPMVRHRRRWAQLSLKLLVVICLCAVVAVATLRSPAAWIAGLAYLVGMICLMACPSCLLVSLVCWGLQGWIKPEFPLEEEEPVGFTRTPD